MLLVFFQVYWFTRMNRNHIYLVVPQKYFAIDHRPNHQTSYLHGIRIGTLCETLATYVCDIFNPIHTEGGGPPRPIGQKSDSTKKCFDRMTLGLRDFSYFIIMNILSPICFSRFF